MKYLTLLLQLLTNQTFSQTFTERVLKTTIWIFIFLGFSSCQKTDLYILKTTNEKLRSAESIEYELTTHYVQKDMGLDKIDIADSYFDFTSSDTLIGTKYLFKSQFEENVFNGKQEFSLDLNQQRILYTNEPRRYDVSNSLYMMNSIFVVRKLLPEFINDSSITVTRLNDTTLRKTVNYRFHISIKDRYINLGGVLTKSEKPSNHILTISKDSYLPIQFKTIFSDNKGHLTANFSNIQLDVFRPDSIWEMNRFSDQYLRLSYKDFFESIQLKTSTQIGQKAPSWKLQEIDEDTLSSADLKGNLVLLEFWFPYCVGCVKAISDINQIQTDYSHKGLKIYGIEFTQSNDNVLKQYIRKQNIEIPTLYNGKEVARKFGVNAAPTFFLVGKDGVIKYLSTGFNKSELINAIEINL